MSNQLKTPTSYKEGEQVTIAAGFSTMPRSIWEILKIIDDRCWVHSWAGELLEIPLTGITGLA